MSRGHRLVRRLLLAFALTLGTGAACQPAEPTAVVLIVSYEAPLQPQQVAVQVTFVGAAPQPTYVFPSVPAGPLPQGSTVAIVFEDGDADQEVDLQVAALDDRSSRVLARSTVRVRLELQSTLERPVTLVAVEPPP